MNIGHKDWFPVYINPTLEEIEELTDQQWDTLRILVVSDTKELCIASGYGNTHSTMVKCLQANKQKRRVHTQDAILYFEGNRAYINDSYSDLGDKIPAKHWNRLFEENHRSILEVLATNRGLQL